MTCSQPNRLSRETSPYLLQHAHNPVDWYPWSEEALETAHRLDRPILLSIGYSACHWCHVMERESFENRETAELMNRLFINIKVDREERPDLDSIYMTYVQMTTGQGGWPLTVFLTPACVPFFGGTYFPPNDAYGRPGFPSVLRQVAQFFGAQRNRIEENRDQITRALAESGSRLTAVGTLSREPLREACRGILQQLDPINGGLGRAPKFPAAMVLRFLLRRHDREASPSSLEAVDLSLGRMARGGIYDHLGGGFHRYSVDEHWLVPHFEKMLYDNALLARTYLEAYQVTGNERYRTVVEQTLAYVQREMTHAEGGFFSAEDADSEGEEGRYYVWTWEELRTILGEARLELFAEMYGASPWGNWEGVNILNLSGDLSAKAAELGISEEALRQRLDRDREDLLTERFRRPRPALDDKVLASWNGLMLAAFAEAGFVLERDDFLQTARRNAEFLLREMWHRRRLYRSWRDGSARLNGYLDDYAHVAEGLLSLFQAGGEFRWLKWATELVEVACDQFMDEESGVFYDTSKDHETLLVRPRELLDNATPSGNSSMAIALILLSRLTGEPAWLRRAERLVSHFSNALGRYPTGMGHWLTALDLLTRPAQEVVIIGSREARTGLLAALRRRHRPAGVVLQVDPAAADVPWDSVLLRGRRPESPTAVAYVCSGQVCREPTADPIRLWELLEEGEA